jgi:hypothetical protein
MRMQAISDTAISKCRNLGSYPPAHLHHTLLPPFLLPENPALTLPILLVLVGLDALCALCIMHIRSTGHLCQPLCTLLVSQSAHLVRLAMVPVCVGWMGRVDGRSSGWVV